MPFDGVQKLEKTNLHLSMISQEDLQSVSIYIYNIYINVKQDMPSVRLEKRCEMKRVVYSVYSILFRTQMAYDRRCVDAIKL